MSDLMEAFLELFVICILVIVTMLTIFLMISVGISYIFPEIGTC